MIKEARKAKKITLKEMERKTGYSNGYISMVERGIRKPSIKFVKTFSYHLQVDENELIDHFGLNKQMGDSKKINDDIRRLREENAALKSKLNDIERILRR